MFDTSPDYSSANWDNDAEEKWVALDHDDFRFESRTASLP
jgi:hypothetical protein